MSAYGIVRCNLGEEALRQTLNAIAEADAEVVSVVLDHKDGGSGRDFVGGFLIVTKTRS